MTLVQPLARIAVARPHMLAEHASAYAELLADEVATAAGQLKRQLVFELVGLSCFAVAAVLIGVAVMLWASLPAGSLRAPWMLALAPAVPSAFGIWALATGISVVPNDPFAMVRRQLMADAAMLHNGDGS